MATIIDGTNGVVFPSGTTSNRPANPTVGMTRYNTDIKSLEQYTESGWVSNASNNSPLILSASVSYISGNMPSDITLSGINFGTSSVVVVFTSGSTTANVTVAPSNTSVTVAVPSQIYTLPINSVVSITLILSSGIVSNAFSTYVTYVATAAGGTITNLTAGNVNYKVHTFTSSGEFVVSDNTLLNVEYLVIAGGGGNAVGAGGQREAGSGAGGYRSSVYGELSGGNSAVESKLSLAPGSYTVTIGAGGTGHANGNNSVFGSITSVGGGFGGNSDGMVGANGGSGGGSWYTGSISSGTTGQGSAGGAWGGYNNWTGGGGGGAGGAGSASGVGLGGVGLSSSINGSAVTRAVGGRSNEYSGSTYNASGTANTGNGGSGVGNGGSGIVIIRYPV